MNTLRVLVTNARRRKAIPIVRSLAEAGMHVICADTTRWAASFYSRACHERLVHPEVGSEAFLDFLISWLSRNSCDVIFALDDNVLDILSFNRHRLPNPSALLAPEAQTVRRVNNKAWLIPYAASLGIAVPKTVVIQSQDDLTRLRQIGPSALVKPSQGSGGRGLRRAQNREQLREACERIMAQGHAALVQEIIPEEGHGLGYFALYDRQQRLIAQFMHRRLREYPIDGGSSTLREGVWDETLAGAAKHLLESLDWVGLAMVEFKEDVRDGIPKLMEINPRFWGSIALPIFSGVDFPVLAARVSAGQEVEPVLSYPLGNKARWLWPGDILHLLSSLRRGRWPRGFFHFFDSHTRDDMLSLRDPLPTLMFTLECFRKATQGR
jgi:predicted ATP-grasp superfamily ATP-dependent carboligase